MSKTFIFAAISLLALAVIFVMPGNVDAQNKNVQVIVKNSQAKTAKVSINLGAYPTELSTRRNEVKSQFQKICTNWTDTWSCNFDLAAGDSKTLTSDTKWYNLSIAFNAPGNVIRCPVTQAELNVNTPTPKNDAFNVSLVNGYNEKIQMTFKPETGAIIQTDIPANAIGLASGNENKKGVYPSGCTICTYRLNPPSYQQDKNCPDYKGNLTAGCHFPQGKEFEKKPNVPCHFELTTPDKYKGVLTVELLK